MKKVRIVVDIPISDEALEEHGRTAEQIIRDHFTVEGDAMQDAITIAREALHSDDEFFFDGDDAVIVSRTLMEADEE